MKNKLRELFYVPEDGKITEKVLFARLSVYITVILLCLASMSHASFAYFSASVVSESNTIQAAHFDVEIFINEFLSDSQSTDSNVLIDVMHNSSNVYSAILEGGKKYSVTIRATGTASTGFVVMVAGENRYFTQKMDQNLNQILTFQLVVDDTVEVSFMPHFGTSSHYEDYRNGVEDPFYVIKDSIVELVAA